MTEVQEQEALIKLARMHPIARLLYAIPNDGKRAVWEGVKFKRRGLLPGMPDLCLPYAANGYGALYIEMKNRRRTNHLTAAQAETIEKLRKAGNAVCVAYGWEEAWKQVEDYLEGRINK
jgi:hypothetical protein